MGAAADERRLAALVKPKLTRGERIVGWTRAWVSRVGRWQRVVGLRLRHFVVVTDHRVMLYTVGFWTRRPRRRVYVASRADVEVRAQRGTQGRKLELGREGETRLLVELGRSPRAHAVSEALRAETEPDPAEATLVEGS